MTWLNPAAFVALAAIAAPIVIHMLFRRRAQRVPFPTVRFISATNESAFRLQTPSESIVLVVRIGTVACAALALAQPLFLTEGREAAWAQRTVRALVTDATVSDDPGARDAADADARNSFRAKRFTDDNVGNALDRAIAWLASAPPARREIVILSDFRLGSIQDADIQRVPHDIGIRTVALQGPPAVPSFDAGSVLHGSATVGQHVELSRLSTSVILVEDTPRRGVEVLADPSQQLLVSRLVDTVAAAGAAAPLPGRPISVHLKGSPSVSVDELRSHWVRRAAARLLTSSDLQDIDIRLAERDGTLVISADLAPDSWAAAVLLQAAFNASRDESSWLTHEPERIPAKRIAGWNREPPSTASPDSDKTTESDGRWLWLAALLLLTAETAIRRTPPTEKIARDVRAA